MPAKTKPAAAQTFASVGFYDRDLEHIATIRTELERRDPTRNVKLPDVLRHALAFTAKNMPTTK